MASSGLLEEAWRRAVDLNLRYYSAVGRLAADYLNELAATLGELRAAQSGTSAQATAPAKAPNQPATAIMVLEAEAGHAALGVFLVGNHLDHKVSARVVASAFVDSSGRELRPNLAFDPEVVTLEPNEQMIVRVMATIDETLEPAVSYRGELTIPELVGTKVPIVVRRRPNRKQPAGGTEN